VYPALAVLQSLESEYESAQEDIDATAMVSRSFPPGVDVLWVGVEDGMEKDLIQRSGIPFETIPAAGVHGVGWRRLPGNMVLLAKGYGRSREILKRFKPDVLFFTGGFIAVPMAIAGARVPSLLYVPDIEPGLALKTLTHFTDQVAVTVEGSRKFLPRRAQVTVTGYPTRLDLKKWSLDEARKALDLAPGLPTLLAFGGSKGARSINRALIAALPELLSEMQVIHITGQLDWEESAGSQNQLPDRLADKSWSKRYHAFPYLHEKMGAALSAADLVLSRAGASILGEFPLFGLPAILVPYPYAWQYQKTNAQFLEDRGAAVILHDQELSPRLAAQVLELVRNKERRQRMRQAMQGLAQADAAKSISRLLLRLAGEPGPGKEFNG
jgi:UDP-N-acetylglucosamine--N-acetylmuramyl-(pentapeptide) pyrophosphoryl-undecaprenol N-acetylglucosamine transferase